MSRVITHMTMSLDGFIADPSDGVEDLFGWYDAGEVEVPTADERWSFHVDAASAGMLRELLGSTGALVAGRRLFDLTNGWGDSHPMGAPVVLVTHRPLEGTWKRTHVAASVEEAIETARSLAGERDVTISSASIAAQALELGLVDEVAVSLVPVLMGSGIPYFAGLGSSYRLGDPVVVEGRRATHLRYPVEGRS